MKVNPHGYPSFLKPYMGEARYWERIKIPSKFVNAHKNKLGEQTWVLNTEEGRSWFMKIKREGTEYFFRREDWEKLAKHHNLHFGDHMTAFLVGNSEFEVMFHDQTTCCRILASQQPQHSADTSSEVQEIEISRNVKKCKRESIGCKYEAIKKSKSSDMDEEISDTESEEEGVQINRFSSVNLKAKQPYFETIVRKSHQTFMCVPINFARRTGLVRQNRIKLSCENGKTVKMEIVLLDRNRVQLIHGWKSFRKANKIKDGDKCKFTLVNSGLKGTACLSVEKLHN